MGTLLDVGENHELRVDAAETANFKAASMTVMIRVKVAPKVVSFESHTNNMTGNPTSGNATTTLTINRPNGEGNFLLAHITFEKGSDITITAPSSWVLVRRTDRFTDIGQVVFYKVATASEPTSYAWNFSQSVKAAGGILRYSGVDTADPIITSSGAGGDSSTLTAPSVGADAESMLVAFFGFKKKDTTLSEPNGLRRLYNFQNPQDVTTFAADDFRESAGATGNLVSRPSPNNSDKWVAQAVVLRAK